MQNRNLIPLCLAALFGISQMEAQTNSPVPVTAQDVRQMAASLDDLLRQDGKKIVVLNLQGQPRERKASPIDLNLVVPRFAKLLEDNEAEVRKELIDQHQKPSAMVFAHLLGRKTGSPPSALLTNKDENSWIEKLQAQQVSLVQIKRALDKVYEDLSFLAIDEREREDHVRTR